jgi:hypothetical protein
LNRKGRLSCASRVQHPGPFDFTWAFILQPKPDGTTRLVVRERYAYRQWWARFLVETVEVASFVMSLRMLHGIRSRAEGNVERNKPAAEDEAAKDEPAPVVKP